MSISNPRSKNKPKKSKRKNIKQISKHKNKTKTNEPNKDQKKIKRINSRVNGLFDKANLVEIAQNTGFLIRESPITPFIFLYALSMGFFGVEISLNLLAINMNSIFGTNLTGSAFSIRMGQKKSVMYLKACFEKLLTIQLEEAFDNKFDAAFSMFKAVILEDSTTVGLNESVGTGLKGCGGAASKSSIKLNWMINICSFAAIAVDLFSGSTSDKKNASNSLKHIKKGMLIVRDLGYFVISSLRTICDKGAYYLSRVPKDICLYLNVDDTQPLDIDSYFKKVTFGGKSVKIPIFIGKKERFSTNLILQKVPKWVLKQRIKRYKKKNSGKSPSDNFVVWAKYSVYITNIHELLVSDNDSFEFENLIIEIYKIRWQIELLFKKFKSKIKLNYIKVKNKNRVLALVYGKLISILMSLMVLSYAASKSYNGREISLWKVTAWLVSNGRMANAILTRTLFKLYVDLCKEFKLLSKDKQNRNTALEELEKMFPWKRMAA